MLYLAEFVADYSELRKISWFPISFAAVFFVLVVLGLLQIAALGFLPPKWPQIYLELDEEGLIHGRGMWSPRRWSWAEPSRFDCDQRLAFLVGPRILFHPVAPTVMDRLMMSRTRFGPKICLPNHFDALAKEIVAKLNEYRDRALAKPGVGGSQSASAGGDRP